MKHISALSISCYIFLSFFLLTSCAKDGATGPAGAQGATGAAGPAGAAGAAGPAGAKGDTGTANVIYSAWLDVSFQIDQTSLPDSLWFAVINVPKLTAAIVNTGEIKVYMNFGTTASPFVVPLPYFDGGIIINPAFGTGAIRMDANLNVGTITNANGKFLQYRYILIPGGVNARNQSGTGTASVNWNNYKEVQTYLGLKD